MAEITERDYRSADARAVSELARRTMRISDAACYPPEVIEEVCRTSLSPETVAERGLYWHMKLFFDGGRLVGCGAITPYRGRELDESIILTVFVDPDYQGLGIGRMVMEAIERDEFFLRSTRIEIPSSIGARDFYLKFGYSYKDGIEALEPDGSGYRLEKRKERTKP